MKRLLSIAFGLALLVSVGAGCKSASSPVTDQGDWHLAFNLPKDWVMVAPYNPSSKGELVHKITRDDVEVVLQSTDQKILPGDGEAASQVIRKNYTKISVTRYDANRLLSEDLKTVRGQLLKDEQAEAPTYYMKIGGFPYKAVVTTDSKSLAEAENILASVKQVVTE